MNTVTLEVDSVCNNKELGVLSYCCSWAELSSKRLLKAQGWPAVATFNITVDTRKNKLSQ